MVKINYNHRHSDYSQGVGAEASQDLLFDKLIWEIDEVSRFTSYSKGTIYNLVSEGGIPYRKKRGRLKFIPNEILRWITGEL